MQPKIKRWYKVGSIRLYSAQQCCKSSELRLQLEGDDNACNVDRADYHFHEGHKRKWSEGTSIHETTPWGQLIHPC